MADAEVDWKDRNLIKKLYIDQKAFVMVGETQSEACAISIRVVGKTADIVRYADDKAVVASSQKVLQGLMNRLMPHAHVK